MQDARGNIAKVLAKLCCAKRQLLYASSKCCGMGRGHQTLKRIFVAALAAFFWPIGGVAAETFTEQLLRNDAQTHPEWSVMFMDVKVLEEGKERICSELSVNAVSDEGKKAFFFPPFVFIAPGTYTIVNVYCKFTARLNGRFARFRVGRNEIINAGRLVIDFTMGPIALFGPRKFTGRTSVEDLGARAVQRARDRLPSVFPKATKRYMTPNPATSGRKPS